MKAPKISITRVVKQQNHYVNQKNKPLIQKPMLKQTPIYVGSPKYSGNPQLQKDIIKRPSSSFLKIQEPLYSPVGLNSNLNNFPQPSSIKSQNVGYPGNPSQSFQNKPMRSSRSSKETIFLNNNHQFINNQSSKIVNYPTVIKDNFIQQKQQKKYFTQKLQIASPKYSQCYSAQCQTPTNIKTNFPYHQSNQRPNSSFVNYNTPSNTPYSVKNSKIYNQYQVNKIQNNSNNQYNTYNPRHSKSQISKNEIIKYPATHHSTINQNKQTIGTPGIHLEEYQSLDNYYPPIVQQIRTRENSNNKPQPEVFKLAKKLSIASRSEEEFKTLSILDNIKKPQTTTNKPAMQQIKQSPQPMLYKNNKIILKNTPISDKTVNKQHKVNANIKRQALNNLKKQSMANNKIKNHNIQYNNEEYMDKNKNQITHIFNINGEKEPIIKKTKMSLQIIQERPYRNQVRQPIKNVEVKYQVKEKKTNAIMQINKRTQKKPKVIICQKISKKGQRVGEGFSTPTSTTKRQSEKETPPQRNSPISVGNRVKVHRYLDQTMEQTQSVRQSFKISDFIQGPQLGRGKFGVVNLARHRRSGFLCALKTMKKKSIKQERIIEQVIRQIKVQYFLNHYHLVKLYGFFHDKESIYLILQFCPDGQLYSILQRLKKFSEQDTCHIMKQLCQGILEMHRNFIIHRDMKPENVVVSFGMCKICDFGWSIYSKQQFRNTLCGTPLYFSPQLLLEGTYNYKVDIWALGMMAFQMITGSIPFSINSPNQLMKIAHSQIHYPATMSLVSRDFIGMFLQRDPQLRFCLKAILQHKFFQQFQGNNQLTASKSLTRIIL